MAGNRWLFVIAILMYVIAISIFAINLPATIAYLQGDNSVVPSYNSGLGYGIFALANVFGWLYIKSKK